MKRLTLLCNSYVNQNQLTFDFSPASTQVLDAPEIANLDLDDDNDESIFEADMPKGYAETLLDDNALLVAVLDYDGDIIEQKLCKDSKAARREAYNMAGRVERAIMFYPTAERVVVRNAQQETEHEIEITRSDVEEFAEAY